MFKVITLIIKILPSNVEGFERGQKVEFISYCLSYYF